MSHAIEPHGGVLKDLIARDAPIADQLNEEARDLNDWFLTEVSANHLQLERLDADARFVAPTM